MPCCRAATAATATATAAAAAADDDDDDVFEKLDLKESAENFIPNKCRY